MDRIIDSRLFGQLLIEAYDRGSGAPLVEYTWNADGGCATFELLLGNRRYLYTSPRKLKAMGCYWVHQWSDAVTELRGAPSE